MANKNDRERLAPIELLEHTIQEQFSAKNVVCCSSGTSALHLALEAFQLPLGTRVLIPDYSMCAVARSVILAGHVPILVDCDNDGQMDSDLIEKAIDTVHSVRACIVVHNYGRVCNTNESTYKLMRNKGIHIVEDAAELHGTQPTTYASATTWSFYQNKVLFGAEGGAVSFSDPDHAKLARSLRCLGFTPEHNYTHTPRGHNYRLSVPHAHLIQTSFDRAEVYFEIRKEMEQLYDRHCPDEWKLPNRDSMWVYDFQISGIPKQNNIVTNEILKKLNSVTREIRFRCGFVPMSQQEEFKQCWKVYDQDNPNYAPRSQMRGDVFSVCIENSDVEDLFNCTMKMSHIDKKSRLTFEIVKRVIAGADLSAIDLRPLYY